MYNRADKKHCVLGFHDEYTSQGIAERACATDENCYGVYDAGCDDRDAFRLCDLDNKRVMNSHSSCIYVKNLDI